MWLMWPDDDDDDDDDGDVDDVGDDDENGNVIFMLSEWKHSNIVFDSKQLRYCWENLDMMICKQLFIGASKQANK